MEITRRGFLGAATAACLPAAVTPAYHLIAHRGGIVDEQHAENSPGSIQAAIDRGYWMIEVDIRRTRDGEPVLQHDPDFRRFYGDPRKVEDVTWEEASHLRSNPGGTSPLHFSEVCRMCEGKIALMLDIKGSEWPDEFYANLATLLRRHRLLRTAYLLGGGARPASMMGPECYQSCNRTSLRQAVERGEDVKSRYFLFELASDLNAESFELCHKTGVVPVAAINTFRYTMSKRDEWKGAEEDAAKMKALGVRHYQIDSRYEALFAKA